jgi:hypothetical protein
VKFGVCRLRLCGGESPVCAFEKECAGADQGDRLTRARDEHGRPYRDSPRKVQRNDPSAGAPPAVDGDGTACGGKKAGRGSSGS